MQVSVYRSTAGDWIDVFINDKKVYGGHTLDPVHLLNLLVQHGAALSYTSEEVDEDGYDGEDIELGTSC